MIQAVEPEDLYALPGTGDPLYGPLLSTERMVAGRYPALGSRFWLCFHESRRPAALLNGRPAGLFTLCALPSFVPEEDLLEEIGVFLCLNGCRTLCGAIPEMPLLCRRAGLPPPRSAPVMKTDGYPAAAGGDDPRILRADEDARRIFSLICPDGGNYDEWLCGLRVRAADGFCAPYALYEDGVPVAAALFMGADTHHAVIGGVAACPERQGYGSAIVRYLTALASRTGKAAVVACADEALAAFYRRLGFIVCGRWYSASADDQSTDEKGNGYEGSILFPV